MKKTPSADVPKPRKSGRRNARPDPRSISLRSLSVPVKEPEPVDSHFTIQPTEVKDLSDAEPLLANLAIVMVEAMAGARNIEQIARWLTESAYQQSLRRSLVSVRALRAKGAPMNRPRVSVRSIITRNIGTDVVEGTVILNENDRVTAVAIRMRGWDRRWHVESIHVL
ncbi:MAG: uncharacterized protein JWQ43_1014 [Glaciihabitans sp.]|nr:uncharacterized protein [Glaciihabitans sp.]